MIDFLPDMWESAVNFVFISVHDTLLSPAMSSFNNTVQGIVYDIAIPVVMQSLSITFLTFDHGKGNTSSVVFIPSRRSDPHLVSSAF